MTTLSKTLKPHTESIGALGQDKQAYKQINRTSNRFCQDKKENFLETREKQVQERKI